MKPEWDYSVSTKELQVSEPEGHLLRTKYATVDDSSGEILGLVSPRYSLVQNRELYEAMNSTLGDLGAELQSVSVVKDKRATLFRYSFGEDRIKTIENSVEANDRVKFGFEIFNSFDSNLGGSCFRAWAERLVCTNGLSVPKEVGRIALKDFGAITGTCFRDTLLKKLDPILETVSVWNLWAQTTPSRIKVGEFVHSSFGRKRSEEFLNAYDSLTDKSIWGLYNLITYYISHDAKSKIPTDIRLKQWELENKMAKLYKLNLN